MIVRTIIVAFRSAKVALIRGAKGDNGTIIYPMILSSLKSNRIFSGTVNVSSEVSKVIVFT